MTSNPDNNSTEREALEVDGQLVSLLSMYYDDWRYRDDSVWKHTYKMFIATVFIMILPNLAGKLKINLNVEIFRYAGLAIAIFSFYVGMAYAVRLEASGDTFSRLLGRLPVEYQRTTLHQAVNTVRKKDKATGKYTKYTPTSEDIPGFSRHRLWFKRKVFPIFTPSMAYVIPTVLFIACLVLFFILRFIADVPAAT